MHETHEKKGYETWHDPEKKERGAKKNVGDVKDNEKKRLPDTRYLTH